MELDFNLFDMFLILQCILDHFCTRGSVKVRAHLEDHKLIVTDSPEHDKEATLLKVWFDTYCPILTTLMVVAGQVCIITEGNPVRSEKPSYTNQLWITLSQLWLLFEQSGQLRRQTLSC